MTTLEQLLGLIVASTESYPIHHAVAAYADAHEGKPITKRDVAALEAANPGWRFRIHSSDTSWNPGKIINFWQDNKWTETRSDLRVSVGPGLSRWLPSHMIMAHDHNARYFKYADERNAERASLCDADTGRPIGLAQAAQLVDQIACLHAELKGVIGAYDLAREAAWKIREILNEKTKEDFKLY